MQELKKSHPDARIIQSRWVVARKSDVEGPGTNRGQRTFGNISQLRQMGYSSPTPSVESLHVLLAHGAVNDCALRSLDISHAFMHSPYLKARLSYSSCRRV